MSIIVRNTLRESKPEIDLNGPEGNAYTLLAHACSFSKKLGLDYDTIHAEMTSRDYKNLVNVFDSHFGDYVNLIVEVENG